MFCLVLRGPWNTVSYCACEWKGKNYTMSQYGSFPHSLYLLGTGMLEIIGLISRNTRACSRTPKKYFT